MGDVWSLGISLIETINNQYPYHKETDSEISLIRAITEGDVPKITKNHELYSNSMKSFMEKCLQKNVAERSNYDQLKEDEFCTRDFDEGIVSGFMKKVFRDLDASKNDGSKQNAGKDNEDDGQRDLK